MRQECRRVGSVGRTEPRSTREAESATAKIETSTNTTRECGLESRTRVSRLARTRTRASWIFVFHHHHHRDVVRCDEMMATKTMTTTMKKKSIGIAVVEASRRTLVHSTPTLLATRSKSNTLRKRTPLPFLDALDRAAVERGERCDWRESLRMPCGVRIERSEPGASRTPCAATVATRHRALRPCDCRTVLRYKHISLVVGYGQTRAVARGPRAGSSPRTRREAAKIRLSRETRWMHRL